MNFLEYNESDFYNHLKKLGLKKKMQVVIHSSLILFLNKKSPEYLFRALSKIIGDGGTIFFPLFTFKKHGNSIFKKFESRPNAMGLLSNHIWQNYRDDINRSNCFIHSYGAYGKNLRLLDSVKIDRSYGAGSFFDFAYKQNMFFISFGLNLSNGCTQIHNSESLINVPYKKKTYLKRRYEIDGLIKKVKYKYHIKSKRFSSDFSKLEKILIRKKIIKKVNLTSKIYSLSGNIERLQDTTIQEIKKNSLLLVK